MTVSHPYRAHVADLVRLMAEGKRLPLGGLPLPSHAPLGAEAPRVLIFAPHPDDECLVGALPLRLRRQAQMEVIDVAVTLGSHLPRRAGRLGELKNACEFLGFGLITPLGEGLERINANTRAQDRAHWAACVEVIAAILTEQKPTVVFLPHEGDWNSTHVGTHLLVRDALERVAGLTCYVVETEYWGAMTSPNLMVEVTADELADLMAATSFHVGEVRRNPYHLSLPAFLQDNVRRGAELVGGQGRASPDFPFAALYRLRRFRQGALEAVYEGGQFVRASDDPARWFV